MFSKKPNLCAMLWSQTRCWRCLLWAMIKTKSTDRVRFQKIYTSLGLARIYGLPPVHLKRIKEATSRYFESFLWRPKLRLKSCEPKNHELLRKKNTKGVILEQKGTRMAEDGEDWNGLEMTILKSLANFSKTHERWRSSFKLQFDFNVKLNNWSSQTNLFPWNISQTAPVGTLNRKLWTSIKMFLKKKSQNFD